MEDAGRKHPVHWPAYERNNLSVIVFLTVCTDKRKRILASSSAVDVINAAWRIRGPLAGGPPCYHIHLFCSPSRPDALGVKNWAKFWKSEAPKHWPEPNQHPIWQIDSWDTQLRRGDSYSEKWEYVRNNPVRHGLIKNADDLAIPGRAKHDRVARSLVGGKLRRFLLIGQ